MILHIVSSSPDSSNALNSCLRVIGDADKLVLCGDGCYAALPDVLPDALSERCFALDADLSARGLTNHISDLICVIDYPRFVQLAVQCHTSQSWY